LDFATGNHRRNLGANFFIGGTWDFATGNHRGNLSAGLAFTLDFTTGSQRGRGGFVGTLDFTTGSQRGSLSTVVGTTFNTASSFIVGNFSILTKGSSLDLSSSDDFSSIGRSHSVQFESRTINITVAIVLSRSG